MKKKLKDFVSENRRAFDEELPSPAAWDRIEASIEKRKKKPGLVSMSYYKWAAVAAAFFIVAASIYLMTTQPTTPNKALVKQEQPPEPIHDTEGLTPEYAALAKKIFKTIASQQQQLKNITADQPRLYDQFEGDLAALDSAYQVLKNQAVQTPNPEVIIRAMMQNLQLQAELLSKQLGVIHDFKNSKPKKNEKNNYQSL